MDIRTVDKCQGRCCPLPYSVSAVIESDQFCPLNSCCWLQAVSETMSFGEATQRDTNATITLLRQLSELILLIPLQHLLHKLYLLCKNTEPSFPGCLSALF